ncbi:hypothetical protein Tco_0428318 [Tanacetum coccineum]
MPRLCSDVMTHGEVLSGSAQFLGHRLVRWSTKKQKKYCHSIRKLNTMPYPDAVLQILWSSISTPDYGLRSKNIQCIEVKWKHVADSIGKKIGTTNCLQLMTDCVSFRLVRESDLMECWRKEMSVPPGYSYEILSAWSPGLAPTSEVDFHT